MVVHVDDGCVSGAKVVKGMLIEYSAYREWLSLDTCPLVEFAQQKSTEAVSTASQLISVRVSYTTRRVIYCARSALDALDLSTGIMESFGSSLNSHPFYSSLA